VPEPLAARVCRYLTGHGWTESSPCPAGTMWIPPGRRRGVPLQVVVPLDVAPGSREWAWLVRRVAEVENRPPAAVTAEILGGNRDPRH